MPTLVQWLFVRQNKPKNVKSKVLFLWNMDLYPTRSYSLQDNMGAYIYSQSWHNLVLWFFSDKDGDEQ